MIVFRESPWGAGALSPLAPYVFVALAIAGLLTMYLRLKGELRAQAKRNRRVEAMLMRLKEASAAGVAAAGAAGHASAEGTAADSPPLAWTPSPARPGMNLSRRVQALRLLRRGEDLGHIASALGVPRCEVELLVRVHRMSAAAAAASAEATPSLRPIPPPPSAADS